MLAQLKLTGIPQSANDEIYNEAKGMAQFEEQILDKFISVYSRKENVQLINMINIGKENAGTKKTKST